MTDRKNCGSCGRSCSGEGPCSAGMCEPELLLSEFETGLDAWGNPTKKKLGQPGPIVAALGRVVFVEQNASGPASVVRIPRFPSDSPPVCYDPPDAEGNSWGVFPPCTKAGNWTDCCRLDGVTPRASEVPSISTADSDVCWVERDHHNSPGTEHRVQCQMIDIGIAANSNPPSLLDGIDELRSVVAAPPLVYWANQTDGVIRRASIDLTGPAEDFVDAPIPSSLAVGGG